MNRRRFIVAASTLAATAAGAFGILRFTRKETHRSAPPPEPLTPEQQALSDHLRQNFPYLEFDDEVLWAYLADLRKFGRRPSESAARAQFLLSTDFFGHDGDEQRPLRYRQLYDPYVSPCYNPMTRSPS